MSLAASTLQQARLFLADASDAKADRERFRSYFEAAVVLGRSVTFRLQKEYAYEEGFRDWWEEQQDRMREDQMLCFFRDLRTYILKEGRVAVRKHMRVTISDTVRLSSKLSVHIIRAKPWYRRRPKILLNDLQHWAAKHRRRFAAWRSRSATPPKSQQSNRTPRVELNHEYFFDDPDWGDGPATELLGSYLQRLEPFVMAAKRRFGGSSSP